MSMTMSMVTLPGAGARCGYHSHAEARSVLVEGTGQLAA